MAVKSSGQFLKRLRGLMKNANYVPEAVQAYIVPSGDAHQSEYIAPCDKRREFITGFTGSAGTAIITQDEATLWTDGRYWLQAERELDSCWTLKKDALPGGETQQGWLSKVLPPSSRIGVDPFLISYSGWKKLSDSLAANGGHVLVPCHENLIDLIWDDKPPIPCHPIVPLDIRFTGKSWQEKITEVRRTLSEKSCDALVLTALDEVAYLFNLRGSDIEFNPVFFAYSVITSRNI